MVGPKKRYQFQKVSDPKKGIAKKKVFQTLLVFLVKLKVVFWILLAFFQTTPLLVTDLIFRTGYRDVKSIALTIPTYYIGIVFNHFSP